MTELAATVPLYISTVPDSDFDDDLAMFVGEAPDADVTLVTADNFKDVIPAGFGQMQVFVYNTPQDAFVAREAMADMQVGDEMISAKLPCGHGAVLRITNEGAEASIKVIDRRSTPTDIMTEILPIVISPEVSESHFGRLADENVMENAVATTSRFIASKLARQLGDMDIEVSTSLNLKLENHTGYPKAFINRTVEDVINGIGADLSTFTDDELDQLDSAINAAQGRYEPNFADEAVDKEIYEALGRLYPELYEKLMSSEPEPEEDENTDTPAPM